MNSLYSCSGSIMSCHSERWSTLVTKSWNVQLSLRKLSLQFHHALRHTIHRQYCLFCLLFTHWLAVTHDCVIDLVYSTMTHAIHIQTLHNCHAIVVCCQCTLLYTYHTLRERERERLHSPRTCRTPAANLCSWSCVLHTASQCTVLEDWTVHILDDLHYIRLQIQALLCSNNYTVHV